MRIGSIVVAVGVAACSGSGTADEGAADSSGATESSTSALESTTTGTSMPADSSSGEGPQLDVGVDEGTTYLLALSTPTEPDLPLQFLAEIVVEDAELSVTLQPLSLDMGSTTAPRQPVGDPLVATVDFVTPAFTASFAETTIPGAANPITGSDIVLSMELVGMLAGAGAPCGTAQGSVTAPVAFELEGSTWAAVAVSGVDDLPTDFPTTCP